MRIVNGKRVRELGWAELAAWRARYPETVVDLGAGDGRFVRHLASRDSRIGAIGVDLCAANLRAASRAAGGNALFVVADALTLPEELHGAATRVTISFPWGSLLRGLLTGHPALLAGLHELGRGETPLEITLNAEALMEAGWTFEAGGEQVITNLRGVGITVEATATLGTAELRHWPTTWAKRLAFGRDPRALHVIARFTSVLRPPSPSCYTSPLAGVEPVSIRICEPFCSVGRVSAQPHRGSSGASPQEGGLVARARTRAPQI